MINSDLVTTLRALTKQEQSDLIKFLDSPYCVADKDAARSYQLVSLILNALSAGDTELLTLDQKVLYATMYPENHKFAYQTIHNLASTALTYVRKFIVCEMAQRTNRPVQENTDIFNFFLEKGNYELAVKYLNWAEREKDLVDSPDNYDSYCNWRFEASKSIYLGMQTEQKGDFNMKEALFALEEYYLIERLEMLTSLFNLNHFTPVVKEEAIQQILAEIDRWANKPFFNNPLIQISRKALLFLATENAQAEQEFNEFIVLLAKHENSLSLYHIKRMESLAYNFCATRFDQPFYQGLIFDLYRRRMNTDRLSKEKTIQASELLSMVKTGLLQEQYELVQSLLDTFRTQIKGRQSSEKYYQFCLAMLCFYTGKLDEAQAIIIHLNFYDTMYKLMAKTLEIKLIYEDIQDNFDLMKSKLGAFKTSLSREDTLSPDKLKSYRDFVNLMVRLNNWHGHLGKNWGQIREMLLEVQSAEHLPEKIWLEKKLELLLTDAPPDA